MTNAELIAKIKAEIDKRYAEYREKMKSDDFTYYEGMADALDLFEQFIDTIESEKPMNPDDAMKELDEKIALVKQRGTWDGVDVDKYMDEVRGREPEKPMNLEEEINRYLHEECSSDDEPGIHEIAEHFAEWGYLRAAEKYNEIEYNRQRAEEKPTEQEGLDVTDFCKPIDPGIAQCIADHFWEMLGEDEKPVPNDLEEAAKDYTDSSEWSIGENLEHIDAAFITGAKWQAEQLLKSSSLPEDTVLFNKGVEEGKRLAEEEQADLFTIVALDAAQRAKEQMMKDGIEGEICHLGVDFLDYNISELDEYIKRFKVGDKVRIIIVKE